jgi:hypothetical protein
MAVFSQHKYIHKTYTVYIRGGESNAFLSRQQSVLKVWPVCTMCPSTFLLLFCFISHRKKAQKNVSISDLTSQRFKHGLFCTIRPSTLLLFCSFTTHQHEWLLQRPKNSQTNIRGPDFTFCPSISVPFHTVTEYCPFF